MRVRISGILIILVCMCSVSLIVSAQGALLSISVDSPYKQAISLEPGSRYAISFNMYSDQDNTIVNLMIELYDQSGNQVGITQVQRGLGERDRWYLVGIEFDTPNDFSKAILNIDIDKEGLYWWDSMRITKLHISEAGLSEYWEEKFNTYEKVYTGLVIDARGLNVERGMSPSIWSESGQLIYRGMTVSYDFLQDVGLVSYGHELTPELLTRIEIDSRYPIAIPLIINAISAIEPTCTSVIISDESAEQIIQALAAYDFLARFAVIFLID